MQTRNDKWNEALNACLEIIEKFKGDKMEIISKDTMRYVNAAYMKRAYGK